MTPLIVLPPTLQQPGTLRGSQLGQVPAQPAQTIPAQKSVQDAWYDFATVASVIDIAARVLGVAK